MVFPGGNFGEAAKSTLLRVTRNPSTCSGSFEHRAKLSYGLDFETAHSSRLVRLCHINDYHLVVILHHAANALLPLAWSNAVVLSRQLCTRVQPSAGTKRILIIPCQDIHPNSTWCDFKRL